MKNLLFTFFLILILTLHVQAQKPLIKAPAQQKIQKIEADDDIVEGDETDEESLIYSEEEDQKKGIEQNDNLEITEKDMEPSTPPPVENLRERTTTPYSSGGGDRYRIVPYYGIQKPPAIKQILKNGTKLYEVKTSPQKSAGGFRLGPFYPGNLRGDVSGITFQSIYPTANPIIIGFEYEYQFFQKLGKWGLQTGIGFFTASGHGRFLNNISLQALEAFTLVTVPISAGLIYRMQFWDKQPIIPFATVGGDYFGMLEARDDKDLANGMLNFGGAPAWHWAAGVQIQLDWLDREVVWQLDHDYGINHVYLTADVRQVVGLNSIFDFSALYYEGGILFEF